MAPTEHHLLHFSADTRKEGDRILTFHAGDATYRVHAHTKTTRAEARVGNALLQHLPDASFTHYLEVDLPSDSVMMTYLTSATEVGGVPTENFDVLAVHVPRGNRDPGTTRGGSRRPGEEAHPKLAWLLERFAVEDVSAEALTRLLEPGLLHDLVTPFETASSLLYQHPALINLSNTGVPDIILKHCIGNALNDRPRFREELIDLGDAWSRRVPLRENGEDARDDKGNIIFSIEVHRDVRRYMGEPMALALKYSQQMEELQGHTWRMHYGSTLDEQRPAPADVAERAVVSADSTRWTLQALTRMNGLRTRMPVVFQPPRDGGWTISESWSSDDDVPMDQEFVAALIDGRVIAQVDDRIVENAWVGAFPAQTPKDDDFATFTAKHRRNGAGADYAEVAITLDPLRTDLQVDVRLTSRHMEAVLAGVRLFVVGSDGAIRERWRAQPSTQGAYGNLRVNVVNEWLRHLGCYAEFHDAAGNLIVPAGWRSRMPLGVGRHFDAHATRKYIGLLPPRNVVFGIPLPAWSTPFDIPVPESAASVTLYWGGLGTGRYDAVVCPVGITCTTVLGFALPVILLALGASGGDTGFINNLMRDPKVRYGLYALGAALLTGGSGSYIGLAQDPGRAAREVAILLLPALGRFGLHKLALYLARRGAEGAARRAVPLVNLAFLAFDTATTVFMLAQTTAAVVQSPFYYATRLTRSFDLSGLVKPDPEFNRFPDHHDRMVVRVLYDAGNALPLQEHRLPAETISEPQPFRFDELAAGGRIRVFVFVYAANGWQSAMGASPWVDARGDNGTSMRRVEVVLKNALIPLSRSSVYQHRQALAFDGGKRVWKAGSAPVATMSVPAPDPAHRLLELGAITVAQRPGMLAYSWKATGLNLPRDHVGGTPVDVPMHAMQNLSLLEHPEAAQALSPIGFTLPCGVAYDIGAAEDGTGANYYLDPLAGEFRPEHDRASASGFHLRRIELALGTRPRFALGTNASWGRFPRAVDGFVVHPQGYVVGVSTGYSKLYILQLPEAPTSDADATVASLYSGDGARVGLLSQPRAIAIALDGRLLVLEQGNRRIQSFDLSGNPVPYFKVAGSREKLAVLPLRATAASNTSYLDLSVEARGYIFVLAYDDDGSRPDHYRVDVYEPDGGFLVSTPRVAAARIAVDLARSLYTLNWETLVGPERRTEPSVSLWLPPPPAERKKR